MMNFVAYANVQYCKCEEKHRLHVLTVVVNNRIVFPVVRGEENSEGKSFSCIYVQLRRISSLILGKLLLNCYIRVSKCSCLLVRHVLLHVKPRNGFCKPWSPRQSSLLEAWTLNALRPHSQYTYFLRSRICLLMFYSFLYKCHLHNIYHIDRSFELRCIWFPFTESSNSQGPLRHNLLCFSFIC
jgi:hypothetical protein